MADINKLNFSFTDGQTTIHDYHLNDMVDRINQLIDAVGGDTPTPTPTQTVATPTISISGTTATISCSTSGATIYYTTNGNTPTTGSTQYSSPITLSGACTIKAIAVKSGMNNSSVASQSYSPASPVVYKNYATTTDVDQYVMLATPESGLSGLAALRLNNIKTEAEVYLVGTTVNAGLFSTLNLRLGIATKTGPNLAFGVQGPANTTVTIENITTGVHVFDQNTKTGVCHLDGTEYTDTALTSASLSNYWVAFHIVTSTGELTGVYSSKNMWKIKSLKVYDATSNDLVAEIVPATYNGTPCLYDKVTDTPLYPNTGTLAVE